MTAFERSQPHSVFKHAGRMAFTIGIPIQNNPYKEKPFRDLWEKGYRVAKREHEDKKFRERAARDGNPVEKPLTYPKQRDQRRPRQRTAATNGQRTK